MNRHIRPLALILLSAFVPALPAFAQLSIERTITLDQIVPDRGFYVSSFVWSNTGIVSISDVNVQLSLSAAPGTTMRLGQMYASLTHGVALESERVAVLLNRPGVNNINGFGSNLGSLNVWFDDSVSAQNVYGITNASGTYAADGRIGVNPFGPRVAYNSNQNTAGLSALNGEWQESGRWSLLVADAQSGNRAVIDSWTLRVIGEGASNGVVNPGDASTIKSAAGTQTIAAAVNASGTGVNAVNLSPAEGAKLLLSGGLSGAGDFRKQGNGILRLEGVSSNFSGKVVVDSGEVQLASSGALGTSGRLEIVGSNPLVRLVNSAVISNAIVLSNAGTTRFDGSGRLAGGISGTGGIVKEGATTLTIAGVNTFTGPTDVTAGKLVVNGVMSNSPVTVQSNAVIGGTGSVGEMTIFAGGTLAPGNSPGAMTNVGNLTWSGGGFYDWEIFNVAGSPGSEWDFIDVTGQLLFSGLSATNQFSINLFSLSALPNTVGSLSGWNPNTNYSWTILSAGSSITGFNAANFTLNLANFTNNNALSGGLFSLAAQGGDLNLLFTAAVGGGGGQPIPEPGTWAAAALLAIAACYIRLRRRSAAQ